MHKLWQKARDFQLKSNKQFTEPSLLKCHLDIIKQIKQGRYKKYAKQFFLLNTLPKRKFVKQGTYLLWIQKRDQ